MSQNVILNGEPSTFLILLEPHGDLFLVVQYLKFASDMEDVKSLLIKFAVDKDWGSDKYDEEYRSLM